MWSGSSKIFQRTYSISEPHARLFQCTAEHLIAASEGGLLSPENIVAACKFCNQTRHNSKRPLSPENYKKKVLGRLALGRWKRLLSSSTTLGKHRK
ncbi:HNH endonuclease [Ruegeria arenilitoris]|uniref:HNH endonuclease n=1 Tax=Ruegeria arenilitoris TaxID=1173585 RepID=UPI003463B675